ncbi:HdeD family acid-resistance protein [Dactylosporangium sp. CS-047395]|uniref:HdeD family acid-resistance protein n=1 Tax=Dactylosporangium sp. CS-047395 TaxID=3239936 RepID=UPI003D8A5D0A
MATTHWYRRGSRTSALSDEPFLQVLLLGIATALFGLAVLVWPEKTLRLIGIVAGVWLIVLAVVRAVTAIRSDTTSSRRVTAGVMAAILLAAGITCLRNANGGIVVLATLLGLAWLLSGFALLLIAMPARGSIRGWLSVLGFASVLIGLAFMLWPGPSLTTVVLISGVGAVLVGAGEVAFALRLRAVSRIET